MLKLHWLNLFAKFSVTERTAVFIKLYLVTVALYSVVLQRSYSEVVYYVPDIFDDNF